MSMFVAEKMYDGKTANKMVGHMINTYQNKISALNKSLNESKEVYKSLNLKYEKLYSVLESLNCNNTKFNELERENQLLKDINISLERENYELQELIRSLDGRNVNSTDKNIWDNKVLVTSYKTHDDIEIKFHRCELHDGTVYIDARKYNNDKPTRKGICLTVDNFDTFLRYGRTVWARVKSGLLK